MVQDDTYALQRKFFGDLWYHYDRYEVRDGWIRPERGAKLLQYEPWSLYAQPSGKRSIKQPYHALLDLAAHLNADAIASWCSQNGLLGIVPHAAEMVVLAAQTRQSQIAVGNDIPVFTRYVRTPQRWVGIESLYHGSSHSLQPGVFLRRLGASDLSFEPLSAWWSKFFPDVPPDEADHFQYPLPFSPAFWKMYAEPVFEFMAAMKLFQEAIDALTKPQQFNQSARETLINELSKGVSPVLYSPSVRRRFRMGWASPSLLASFAAMAMLDLTRNRILICSNKVCRSFFVSQSTKARYCSPRCRRTAQMRRRRKRNAER